MPCSVKGMGGLFVFDMKRRNFSPECLRQLGELCNRHSGFGFTQDRLIELIVAHAYKDMNDHGVPLFDPETE